MTMLDQLPGIMLAVAIVCAACRFTSGFFRAFDHLDAVIVRWLCEVRFRR
jgi:hypothetical protein